MDSARLFTVCGVPMLGNPYTGHLIGLEPHEVELAAAVTAGELSIEEAARRNSELGEQLRKGAYGLTPPATVKTAYLHVTHRCNLQCEGCYSQEDNRNNRLDPTLEQLDNALAFLSSKGVEELNVSGGEPFLRRDLPQILEIATIDHGIPRVNILTNGTQGSDEMLAACAPFVHMVSVSFDGASADDPAYIRGEQRFDQLVAFVKRAQRAGISVCITPTLHRLNVNDVNRYHLLADELEVGLGFSLLSPTADSKNAFTDLFPGEKELVQLAHNMLARPSSASGRESIDCLSSGLHCREDCGAGVRSISIDADGIVYPCHMMHHPSLAMGNAFAQDATDMKFDAVPVLKVHNAPKSKTCIQCEFNLLCGGGCKARAWSISDEADSYCGLYKTFYSDVLGKIKEELAKEA